MKTVCRWLWWLWRLLYLMLAKEYYYRARDTMHTHSVHYTTQYTSEQCIRAHTIYMQQYHIHACIQDMTSLIITVQSLCHISPFKSVGRIDNSTSSRSGHDSARGCSIDFRLLIRFGVRTRCDSQLTPVSLQLSGWGLNYIRSWSTCR